MEKSRQRNAALDGVRMVAITLIVASHCNVLGQGGLGNALFFCLSGFLSALPFTEDGERRFLSVKYIGGYYVGRLIRILPIYYVVLVGVKWLTGDVYFASGRALLSTMLFRDGYGHLWFLQQEMVMYALTPPIMIMMAALKRLVPGRRRDLAAAGGMILLTWFSWNFFTIGRFSLYGNGAEQMFRIWLFTIGMAMAYLYRSYVAAGWQLSRFRWFRVLADTISILLLVACVASSDFFLSRLDPALGAYYVGWRHPLLCCALSGVLILLLLANPDGLAARLLGSRPIAGIGKISFGIYLVHWFLIRYVPLESDIKVFAYVYFASACMSYVLYVLVEKPSGMFAKTKKLGSLAEYYRGL